MFSQKKFSSSKIFLSLFFFGLLFAALPSVVKASSVTVTGYAWSSNIGWIKFDTGMSNPVMYDKVTGQLSGYAWSSNIGWIYFGPDITSKFTVSSAPEIPKQWMKADSPASAVSSNVLGWARACAGTIKDSDPKRQDSNNDGINDLTPTLTGDCTTNISRPDGWDGWIKMSGSWSYGVSINLNSSDAKLGEFTGYAWGSDVVGWISFNCSNTNTCGTSDYKVKANITKDPESLTVTCSPSASSVGVGVPVTFTANVNNGTPNYTYVWSGDVPSKTTTKSSLTDTNSQSYSSVGTKNVTIKVKDSSSPQQNTEYTCSVEVTDKPITSSSSSSVTTSSSSSSSGGIAVCGNSLLESGETCDDGNTTNGDGCSSTCQDEVIGSVCGNSSVESGETCDDGNTTSGDGCSSTCQTEGGGGGETLTLTVGCGTVEVKEGGVTSLTLNKTEVRSTSYSSGTELELTAFDSESPSIFESWTGCDSTSGNSCSITMNGDKSVQAIFDPDTCGVITPPSSSSSSSVVTTSSSSSSKPSVIIHEI